MLNNIHKNSHRNHTHRIFYNFKNLEINQSIFAFYWMMHTTNYFATLRILYVRDAGRRGNKITAYSTLTLHS